MILLHASGSFSGADDELIFRETQQLFRLCDVASIEKQHRDVARLLSGEIDVGLAELDVFELGVPCIRLERVVDDVTPRAFSRVGVLREVILIGEAVRRR